MQEKGTERLSAHLCKQKHISSANNDLRESNEDLSVQDLEDS